MIPHSTVHECRSRRSAFQAAMTTEAMGIRTECVLGSQLRRCRSCTRAISPTPQRA